VVSDFCQIRELAWFVGMKRNSNVEVFVSKKTLIAISFSMFLMVAAAQSMSAQTTTGGTIVVNFSITVDATLSPTANIGCSASADVYDGPSTARNVIHEAASVLATKSGSTATCTLNIPYSWSLLTPTTDKIILGFNIVAPVEIPPGTPSAALPSRVSNQPRYAAIPVPVNGTTTTENLTLTF